MKKKICIAALICLLLAAVIYTFLPESKGEHMDYAKFYEYVEQGLVQSAVIGENDVIFQLMTQEQEYYTENPDYDQFKEFLLRNHVEVTKEDQWDQIMLNIMDLMFDLIFFIVFGGAAYMVYRFIHKQFKLVRKSKERFDDIAGMEEIKQDMRQLVDLMKHPEQYEKMGIRQPHGILFAGPPGNGKTMFARALAGEAGISFIAAKATDFQSMYMSIGPAKVKAVFKKARKHAPCILFIDEFDGIGEKRNYAGHAIDKENNRVITSLLNELDGFERNSNGVLVIGATNNIKDLDPALIRAGRFDRKYVVGNPDYTSRMELIHMNLKDKKMEEGITVEELSKVYEGLSCAQIETILNEAAMIAQQAGRIYIERADLNLSVKRSMITLNA